MKNVLLRSLSGAIYVALIVAGVLVSKWTVLALCLLLVVLAQIEYFTLYTHDTGKRKWGICAVDTAGAMILTGGMWLTQYYMLTATLAAYIVYLLGRLVMQIYISRDTPLINLAYSFMGQLYIALPISLLPFLEPHIALAMFIFIWLNDTGAFIVGCTIGRHPLFPRISPKKSWEGFWGGIVFCVAAAILFGTLWPGYFLSMPVGMFIGMAFIVSVFATWGDLVESMLKRTLHVKDSGNIMPGHGGILDRIDSLLCVLPATVCYLLLTLLL
ncbi:MAG: phosphatidate cytidylyltransferase [Muribaculum sp.]|nr:phosphatidate cytidylyltransferase [Muribaculum sp.]